MPPEISDPEKDAQGFLRALMDAAIAAADPYALSLPVLPEPGAGRVVIIAAGKGAAPMARAAEDIYGNRVEGLAVVPDGFGLPLKYLKLMEAGHPVPDERSLMAGARALDLAAGLGPQDLLLGLISGGASALMAALGGGITLAQKQETIKGLLLSGVSIAEINRVRSSLSAIKGGKLAALAAPARVESLLISDVVGNDPALIGSGPTITKSGSIHVLASGLTGLEAAAGLAREAGLDCLLLGDEIEGEARDLGRAHAALMASVLASGEKQPPFLILSGGELTVRLEGPCKGQGGPNTEYALALALGLEDQQSAASVRVYGLAVDTDGIDGSGGHAGALVTPATLKRANERNMRAEDYLDLHDSHGFFQEVGGLITTGPMRTNINDFRAILCLAAHKESH